MSDGQGIDVGLVFNFILVSSCGGVYIVQHWGYILTQALPDSCF